MPAARDPTKASCVWLGERADDWSAASGGASWTSPWVQDPTPTMSVTPMTSLTGLGKRYRRLTRVYDQDKTSVTLLFMLGARLE